MSNPLEETIAIESDGALLDARTAIPDGAEAAIVFCHPHPQYGGDMDNPVVTTVLREFANAGWATLRFNFRGVGASTGSFGDMVGERADAAAVTAALAARCPRARMVLGGYSFGAAIALELGLGLDGVAAVLAVAPPFGMLPAPSGPAGKAVALLVGDADQFCPIDAFEDGVARARRGGAQRDRTRRRPLLRRPRRRSRPPRAGSRERWRLSRCCAPRVSCDSLVALGNATASGSVLFAKNSDRPARECQPLALIPAADHRSGDRVRCQYIEIPQVERTLRVLGSRPFWLWGLEHGVNEAGVAIGNHTVFTRDKPEGRKLIGMDLVRLALERAATATAAVGVICDLVERHGQGGSGYHDSDFPYHSSFLVADRKQAYLIETSDRRWAMREIASVGSATNHVTIGTDWDSLSPDAVEHARQSGWWDAGEERFDFAAAYRDSSWVPASFSSGRYRRTCEILADHQGRISEETLRGALRDHYHGPVYRPLYAPEDERYLSVCMHADPIGATTAAAVVTIPPSAARPIRFSACLGPPCVGVFVPLYIAGEIPAVLTRGGLEADGESPWWRFRRLLEEVESDREKSGPRVRDAWDRVEADLISGADRLEVDLASRPVDPGAELTSYMRESVERVLEHLDRLSAEIAG